MNTAEKCTSSSAALQQFEIPRQAVRKAVERKRRFGHYAVIRGDGKPGKPGEDALSQAAIP